MKKKREPRLNQKFWVAHAKEVYKNAPFATKVYLALKTRLPITFIQKHWEEITNEKEKNKKRNP